MKKKTILIIIQKKKLFYLAFTMLIIFATSFLFFFETDCNNDIFVNSSSIAGDLGNNKPKPKLAIIIDDFGENRSGVKEMMQIKRHLTFAVMPFMEISKQDAIQAHTKGYEVITHLPMESYGGKLSWVGPRPIKTSLSDNEIRKIVLDSFDSVPYAVGANVHMGSKASGNNRVLTILMKVLKEKDLYFVDSRSCRKPIGKSVAEKVGVRFAERNVFLEHLSRSKYSIKKQLNTAGNIAIENGYSVAIGHVGTEGGKVTAHAIEEMIPELESKGIEFVFISELFY